SSPGTRPRRSADGSGARARSRPSRGPRCREFIMAVDGPEKRAVVRVTLLRPLPAPLARVLSALVVLAWGLQMGVLLRRAFAGTPLALAADLASYTGQAQWRGIYYRGDKIGFSVGQTTPTEDGYEIREDARLSMTLVGATTAVRMTSSALVDRAF